MMYETEEQQVEALKKWWRENGKSIIAGVVLGLGGVLGWRAWMDHQDTRAGQASNLFDQLTVRVEQGQADPARVLAEQLRRDYAGTPYAGFSYLLEARLLLEQGDSSAARGALEQAIAAIAEPAIRTIAVLRLARLQLDAGTPDQAAGLLDRHPPPAAFAGEYAALRGDIARARGDTAAARAAYREAIAGQAGNADLLQLKLENLPPEPAS
jgi:predicted negative regulator of RcsB-dependent stress response